MKIYCFFILALLVFFGNTQQVTIKNALRNQVIIDFKDNIVPLVSRQIEHLILPNIRTEASGCDIEIKNVQVNVAPIQPNQISIQFYQGTSMIAIVGSGISMTGLAHIRAKWLFITKSMDATMTINNAGFTSQIVVSTNNGRPNIFVENVNIQLSQNDVRINLSGDVLNKILEFVANLLRGHIVKEIVGQLQSQLPSCVTNAVNSKLNTLPVDIDISNTMNLKYLYETKPIVRSDYISTGINAYVHLKSNSQYPNIPPINVPEFDPSTSRGIQFFISDELIKSATDSVFNEGEMILTLERNMLGHLIKMACKATSPPQIKFVNRIEATVSSECRVEYDNNKADVFTLSTDAQAIVRESMKSNKLYFIVSEASFTRVDIVGAQSDVTWFKSGIHEVIEVIKSISNGVLEGAGVPLPAINGIEYSEPYQYVGNGYMMISTNPIFKF